MKLINGFVKLSFVLSMIWTGNILQSFQYVLNNFTAFHHLGGSILQLFMLIYTKIIAEQTTDRLNYSIKLYPY